MLSFSQHPQFSVEQEKLKCPRCDSDNTKFCYYNNYNLSQPRHFCKSCRRYWTKGGALRNIPVGGGSRKNAKRGSSSASSAKRSATPEEKNEKSPHPKGDGSGEEQFGYFPQFDGKGEGFSDGQLGDLMEAYGTEKPEASPLKLDDFGHGQFGNPADVSGSFSSLLAGGAHFGGFLDGGLHTNYLFCDSDSGQNVDPQTDGLFNVGGWPDLAI